MWKIAWFRLRRSPRSLLRWVSRHALVSVVLALHLAGSFALAQEPARLPKEDKGILQLLVAVGLLLLICVTAFMNPKRSHLD